MLTPNALDLQVPVPGSRAAACPIARQPACPGPGAGRLEVSAVDGCSAVVTCAASSPLQLLVPRPRGAAAWILAASHGVGLVGGVAVELQVSVGAGASACLGTQAETKVYRPGAGRGARQALSATVGPCGLLALLPDPVSPYAGALYEQAQLFELAAGASLVVLDAVTSGRAARGERWAFARYGTRNEVRVSGKTVLADGLRLEAGAGPPLPQRLAGLELLATVIALGPRVAADAQRLLRTLGQERADGGAPVLAAASPLCDGLVLRLASRSVEEGMQALRSHLSFLAEPLDGDPLLRRP
jgi:urease accessory protein